MESVVAQATAGELHKIERFNWLIANAEQRRDALLREIERRRAVFAQKVRGSVEFEDARFKNDQAMAAANENTA
jgi:hypothetical protein